MSTDNNPNVLCFICDQLRYDHLGYAGNDTVETPNIDALSESGVTFERMYANNPMCMPARATLFTGHNPHRHGVRSNGVVSPQHMPMLPELLLNDGYQTHSSGKLHLDLYTLPAPQQVAHIAAELSAHADSEFAQTLRDTLDTILRELLDCPDDLSDSSSERSHEGFSGRADSILTQTLEDIHVPKWSETPLLFREVIEETVADWPVDKLTESDWEKFSEALKQELSSMFEEIDATAYSDLQFTPEEFPESREVWESGSISSLPEPYRGFETTDFTGGHVNEIYGEYKNWLRDTHPDSYDQLQFSHPNNSRGSTFQVLDEWSLPESVHYNHWISNRSIEFLDRQANTDAPFFLWNSYPDPHNPYAAPEPWGSMYDPENVTLPTRRENELDDLPPFYNNVYKGNFFQLQGLYTDPQPEVNEEFIKEIIATTYGMVSYIDHEVGRVMDALEERGLRENTVVVFLSDHGAMMGDHWMLRKGPFQFEELLRVPAIWNWPNKFAEGKRVETVCSHEDFLPTMLDLCNVTSPHATYQPSYRKDPSSWAGRSLVPLLTDEIDEMDRSTVIENDEDYLSMRARTLVTNQYKLTVYLDEDYGELFDLDADPEELYNKWNDTEYTEIKNRLYRELVNKLISQEGAVPSRRNVA